MLKQTKKKKCQGHKRIKKNIVYLMVFKCVNLILPMYAM